MEGVMQVLWMISWQVAILAGVVFIISRLASKSPAAWRHWLWLVVLIKLFVPPFVHLPQMANISQQKSAVSVQSSPISPALPDMQTPAVGMAHTEQSNPTVQVAEAPPAGISLPDAKAVLFWMWIAGMGFMSVRLLVSTARLRRLLRGTYGPSIELISLLQECAGKIGVRRLPGIALAKEMSTPTLAGFLRQTILIPEGISSACTREDICAMLMHELAHVRRWDTAVTWLQQIAQVFFFFHPAVWLVNREIRRERELACDEMVLLTTGIAREEYASGYLSALKLANGLGGYISTLGMAEPFDMERRRLKMIVEGSLPRYSFRWIAALLLIAVVGIPTMAGTKAPHKALPTKHSDLLQYIINGTHEAATAIKSGKGRITVREWTRENSKASREFETIYDVTFSGDKYKLTIDSTVLRNDPIPGVSGFPVPPGYKTLRMVAIDGRRITNMIRTRRNTFTAAIGYGNITPMPEGGYVKGGYSRMVPYNYDISLSGRQLPGNGIIDLSKLHFNTSSFKESITRIIGREVVNGSECVIVEILAPGASAKIDNMYLQAWIDPAKGFTIPRFRRYAEGGPSHAKRFLCEEVHAEIRELAPGVWGTSKVTQTYYRLDYKKRPYKSGTKTIIYDQNFQANIEVSPDDLKLEIPDGTKVYDDSGKEYTWPNKPAELSQSQDTPRA